MLQKKFIEKPNTKEPVFPKNTFEISEVYNPESKSTDRYQVLPEPWPIKPFVPKRPLLIQTIDEAIGWTPLVRLIRIPKSEGVESEIRKSLTCHQVYLYSVVKCEFMNPGGSVKDRIAKRMVELAEETGDLKPGMTVIEPTSGNTGVGLAMMCAIRGYRCIIVMPKKMSHEKEATLKCLGAEIVRTENHHHHSNPDSHIGTAIRLQREIPGSIILDQVILCKFSI